MRKMIKKRYNTRFESIRAKAKADNDLVIKSLNMGLVCLIIMNVPSGLAWLFLDTLIVNTFGQIIIRVADFFIYVFQATGFVLGLVSNRVLRNEFKRTFGLNRVSNNNI